MYLVTLSKDAKGSIPFNEVLTDSSMHLGKTNTLEVDEIIKDLNKNAASGNDDISAQDVVLLKRDLLPILVTLINKAFKVGIFPPNLKISRVTPIHKGGNKGVVDNYRPISVVSSFSKIVELLFKKRSVNFIQKFVKPDPFQ